MLDVHRGVDIYTGVEQLLHILPALGVSRPRSIGVGQFVHQEQRWVAGQRRIEIKGVQSRVAIRDWTTWQYL